MAPADTIGAVVSRATDTAAAATRAMRFMDGSPSCGGVSSIDDARGGDSVAALPTLRLRTARVMGRVAHVSGQLVTATRSESPSGAGYGVAGLSPAPGPPGPGQRTARSPRG